MRFSPLNRHLTPAASALRRAAASSIRSATPSYVGVSLTTLQRETNDRSLPSGRPSSPRSHRLSSGRIAAQYHRRPPPSLGWRLQLSPPTASGVRKRGPPPRRFARGDRQFARRRIAPSTTRSPAFPRSVRYHLCWGSGHGPHTLADGAASRRNRLPWRMPLVMRQASPDVEAAGLLRKS
jgi:hypothetical protein